MGAEEYGGSPLPVRTTRYLRPGRHSSPHQLSLPAEAPALVLAIPGAASPESGRIAAEIAASAGSSCPGATIAFGYLEGRESLLSEVLGELRSQDGRPPAVVVPLLTCPYPEVDEQIAAAVATASVPILVGGHLGPHPFLAEAVHARLSEAGLARAGRSGRISIVTAADGVVVGAIGDAEEALAAAGVVAVLLASRLTIPAVPALLNDRFGLRNAAERLQAAQVTHVALAPCVVGPEVPAAAMAAISAETGLECSPPLGGYPTIGQLVAIRYGAALEDPHLADVSG
jgi:sirohydrochlorin ferrochelatase